MMKRLWLALSIISPLLLFGCKSDVITPIGKIRHYYVAAEEVLWDYAPSNQDLIHGGPVPAPWTNSHIWNKVMYVEYTDQTFTQKVPQPEWQGVMGPTLRGEVGDSIIVHFYNKTHLASDPALAIPLTMHPHGVRYAKESEGAHYMNNTTPGSMVMPGESFTYRWFAHEESGPGPAGKSSRIWWYHSHIDEPAETNLGLLGSLIITRRNMANADATPKDVDKEFIAMFMIFDEAGGLEEGLMHGINGYIYGNVPGYTANKGEKVRWYLLGMGNEIDLHTPHWHGQTLDIGGVYTDVEELLPGSMEVADMKCENPGTWLFHCHVADHISAGMIATYTVNP